ncbi:MAG: hypothetical protein GEV28_02285 [Actinophytocola sp.]|uniref:FG-GAP repeat domain-containing protein n=1 Tax=Actinophytocola sp. TaxID=1872138 RepID=UPI00132433AA|nr:VCBS repeat-containing protein [Actinophytocola sp.]MPZ79272.1 hypothetical protein [Actinophytocola sp.]
MDTHLSSSTSRRLLGSSLAALGLATAVFAGAATPASADHQGSPVPSFDYQDHALVKPGLSGVGPEAIATGDFNGDGHDDTAVGTIPGLQTILSNADGTFQDAVLHEVGNGTTRQVATADLNDDGNLDIAVSRQAYGEAPKVSVLFGAGDGAFASPDDIEVGPVIADSWNTASPIPADVDNDGVPDLVVGIEQLSPLQYTSVVLLNTGDGTFTDPRAVESADGVILRRVADVNGDLFADLVGIKSGEVALVLADGQGAFGTARTFPGGVDPLDVAVGDLNGDGKVDLVTVSRLYYVNILQGTGRGTFSAPTTYTDHFLRSFRLTLVDLNGNGHLDVAAANTWNETFPGTGRVAVFVGNGDGTLQDVRRYVPVVSSPFTFGIAAGDFNADGRPDLIISNNKNHDSVTSVLNTTP